MGKTCTCIVSGGNVCGGAFVSGDGGGRWVEGMEEMEEVMVVLRGFGSDGFDE